MPIWIKTTYNNVYKKWLNPRKVWTSANYYIFNLKKTARLAIFDSHADVSVSRASQEATILIPTVGTNIELSESEQEMEFLIREATNIKPTLDREDWSFRQRRLER